MDNGESRKIEEMRRLAQRLREYSERRDFAAYANSMAHVALELDQCANGIAARNTALQ